MLGFQVNDVERIREQYQRDHPKLIHAFRRYERDCIKVLEVYAYYKAENPGVREKQADVGTLIRFIEALEKTACASCLLPGLTQIDATFDNTSQAA